MQRRQRGHRAEARNLGARADQLETLLAKRRGSGARGTPHDRMISRECAATEVIAPENRENAHADSACGAPTGKEKSRSLRFGRDDTDKKMPAFPMKSIGMQKAQKAAARLAKPKTKAQHAGAASSAPTRHRHIDICGTHLERERRKADPCRRSDLGGHRD